MNTKTILTLIAAALLTSSSCLWAQPELFLTKPWTATLKIVNESGKPVAGASVKAGYIIMPTSIGERWAFGSRGGNIQGLTDTNGMFAATHTDRSPSLGFQVQKAGYYKTSVSLNIGFPEQNANNRNIVMTLVLKKISKPIPMYAKSLNLGMPVLEKPVGYDLMVGDWVGLYGKGISADIFFTGHFDKYTNGESDFTLTVTFPNKGDGIQEFTVPESEKGSGLRSAHEAPENGYQAKWVQTDNRGPGHPIKTNRDPNRNYYFRVRTKIDSRGNIVSTHYGKIYGDFMRFTYYLNPTPNDRNVEFDPKRNLITSLNEFEGVSAP